MSLLIRAGDVVRIQPNYLSFSSLQAIEDVYGTSTEATKSEMYSTLGGENGFRLSVAMETYFSLHTVPVTVLGTRHDTHSCDEL
jgi:hypothetical protein